MKSHLFYSILITETLSFPTLLKRDGCPPGAVLTAYKAADEKVHYICTAYQEPTYEEVTCPSGTIKTAILSNSGYYCEPLYPNTPMACGKNMVLTAHVEQGRSGYICKSLVENKDEDAVTKCETGFVLGQAMDKDGKLQNLCVKVAINTPNVSKTDPTPPKVDVPVVKTEPTPSPKVDVPIVKTDPTPPKVDVPVAKTEPSPPKVDTPTPKVDTPAPKVDTPTAQNVTSIPKNSSTPPKIDAPVVNPVANPVVKPAAKSNKIDFRKDPCPFGQRLLKSYDDKKNEILSCVDVKTIDQQTKVAADGSLVKEEPKPMTIRVVKPPIQVVNTNLKPGEVRSRLVVKTKVVQ